MKWKTKFRRTATTTSAILLAIMLTACNDNNNTNVAPTASPDSGQTQGSVPNDSLPEESGVLDPGTLTPDDNDDSTNNAGSDSESTPNETVSDVISATGTYIGAADGHSVEIQVDTETIVFQIDDSLVHIIDEYEGNQAVKIEYVEKTIEDLDVKQPWLTSIEKQ